MVRLSHTARIFGGVFSRAVSSTASHSHHQRLFFSLQPVTWASAFHPDNISTCQSSAALSDIRLRRWSDPQNPREELAAVLKRIPYSGARALTGLCKQHTMPRPPRPPPSREVQVSKKLSWLLRHHIQDEGLTMTAGGYVNAQDVLNNRHIKSLKVSLDELRQLVAANEKQRFSLVPVSAAVTSATPAADDILSDDPKDFMIRANQGHSLSIDAEQLLTPIGETNLPTTCVHGTTHAAWLLIVASGGLKRMTRQHIHFATGLPEGFKSGVDGAGTSAPVISGMRNSSTVLIYLDIQRALAGGIKFWRSENNVILTEGDETGILPLEYFKLVEDRTGGQGAMVEDGKILKEAPVEWASKGSGRRGGRGGGGGRGQ